MKETCSALRPGLRAVASRTLEELEIYTPLPRTEFQPSIHRAGIDSASNHTLIHHSGVFHILLSVNESIQSREWTRDFQIHIHLSLEAASLDWNHVKPLCQLTVIWLAWNVTLHEGDNLHLCCTKALIGPVNCGLKYLIDSMLATAINLTTTKAS